LLKLVEKPKPESLTCQRMPDWHLPAVKINSPEITLGVRFVCDKCGLIGKPEWGVLQDLPGLAAMAESSFAADFEGSQPHCPWLMGEDSAVPNAGEERRAETSPREVDYFAGRYSDFG
jgi:hypothetical protein